MLFSPKQENGYGFFLRNYSVSPTKLDYEAAHAYCNVNGLRLAKWDTLEKFYDVAFVTGNLIFHYDG